MSAKTRICSMTALIATNVMAACFGAAQAMEVGTALLLRENKGGPADSRVAPLAPLGPEQAGQSYATSATERLELVFADGTSITLGPSSAITIASVRLAEQSGEGEVALLLDRGLVKVVTGPNSRVVLRTGKDRMTVTAGAALVTVSGKEADYRLIAVLTLGRSLEVQRDGTIRVVTRPGFGVTGDASGLKAPTRVDAAELATLLQELTLAEARGGAVVPAVYTLPSDQAGNGAPVQDTLTSTLTTDDLRNTRVETAALPGGGGGSLVGGGGGSLPGGGGGAGVGSGQAGAAPGLGVNSGLAGAGAVDFFEAGDNIFRITESDIVLNGSNVFPITTRWMPEGEAGLFVTEGSQTRVRDSDPRYNLSNTAFDVEDPVQRPDIDFIILDPVTIEGSFDGGILPGGSTNARLVVHTLSPAQSSALASLPFPQDVQVVQIDADTPTGKAVGLGIHDTTGAGADQLTNFFAYDVSVTAPVEVFRTSFAANANNNDRFGFGFLAEDGTYTSLKRGSGQGINNIDVEFPYDPPLGSIRDPNGDVEYKIYDPILTAAANGEPLDLDLPDNISFVIITDSAGNVAIDEDGIIVLRGTEEGDDIVPVVPHERVFPTTGRARFVAGGERYFGFGGREAARAPGEAAGLPGQSGVSLSRYTVLGNLNQEDLHANSGFRREETFGAVGTEARADTGLLLVTPADPSNPAARAVVFRADFGLAGEGASQQSSLSVMTGKVTGNAQADAEGTITGDAYVLTGGVVGSSRLNAGQSSLAIDSSVGSTAARSSTDPDAQSSIGLTRDVHAFAGVPGQPIAHLVLSQDDPGTPDDRATLDVIENVEVGTERPVVAGAQGTPYAFLRLATAREGDLPLGTRSTRTLEGYASGIAESATGDGVTLHVLNSAEGGANIQTSAETNRLAATFTMNREEIDSVDRGITEQTTFAFGGLSDATDALSAYVDDDRFGARAAAATFNGAPSGGVSGAIVSGPSVAAGLPASDQAKLCNCQYVQWGFWLADQMPDSARRDHVHLGTWVVGERPSDLEINSLTGTASYAGHAIGSVFNGQTSSLYQAVGRFQSSWDFGARTGSLAINNFDGANYAGTGVNAGARISGNLSGPNRVGSINGSFYRGGADPAAAMGGRFGIQETAGAAYRAHGTFAAQKQ